MNSPIPLKGLLFDLEVVPEKDQQPAKIIKVGGLRADTGQELEQNCKDSPDKALTALDNLTDGAEFTLGHNIIEHDLPLLQAQSPKLTLLNLPALDTLRLSPLAFPQNPYHRLIKDYKLICDNLNSPLADCRSTLTLFADQQQAFSMLRGTNREELLCYQALLGQRHAVLNDFFARITGYQNLPLRFAREHIPRLLQETDDTLNRDLKVCRTQLDRLLTEKLSDPAWHWPIAYVLAWLRVSGGNSVLAPWVRYQFPVVSQLITDLRDTPCGDVNCQYCQTTHNPRYQLRRYFGFDDFRYESPGQSLQHDVVLAGMQGRHVLAVLATGGGKSLCYQLPALNRFHRNGSLTVIISPLQSLMKDQVDGLLARNIQCAASLNGLLTMPERADVLEKIQLGDIGILLVSPEQFRNKAFRRAICQRQIGAWIFDEAHCLSKWGNDFRPDYLYAARFIGSFSKKSGVLAPVGCFTATAKPDVLADICAHFKETLDIEFMSFLGSHERTNLRFDVLPCLRNEKTARVDALLQQGVADQPGGAVVFVASRRHAEVMADFLINKDWRCRYFHAGIEPNEKKDIQDAFKAGQLQVIVATNAFGMGVDKADIRLVIHADITGSLENYLQEAGRAGRDQQLAHCVLLYDPQDIESQFGLSERSRLSLRDIQQILKKVRAESGRRAPREKDNSETEERELVITAGEILMDDAVDTSFSADDRDAETKVATAVAWLERGHYLRREENCTRIFPAKLTLPLADAEKKLCQTSLPARRLAEFRAVLHFLHRAGADERINTDQLMALTSQTSDEVAAILKQMEILGILENDARITLYIRHGIVGASKDRLQQTLALEKSLFALLSEQAPEAGESEWQDLHLQPLTTALRQALNREDLLPLQVLRLLRSLAQDRDGDSQQRSHFDIRQINRDYLKLRLKSGYSWRKLEAFGEKRRQIADVLLGYLIGKIPSSLRRKDILVEATFGELVSVIGNDPLLSTSVPPVQRRKAVEHILLYLHQQEVLTLNHGMTVMRRAMTLVVNKEKRGVYLKDDYQKLDEHYRERRIQIHVMREYAEIGLKDMAAAQALIGRYFTDPRRDFLSRYFAGREKVLKLATSEDSWNSIVSGLNPAQRAAVIDDNDVNRLILAGPGSGKTRVIVHRIAYLLRVRRIPASSIVALTFNRHAASEIRQRLLKLTGADSWGLTIMTYHAMAMRLTGTSFQRGQSVNEQDLTQLLENAAALLEGKYQAEGDDDVREKLLRGYRYILVDEYQDIDELQYRLVSALAGRQCTEEDGSLCIMAVGDDDQNIYSWRKTSNQYISRFCADYEADTHYLTENYRSSHNIIAAANRVIEQNTERMKTEHPVSIDQARSDSAPGGRWMALDPLRQGRVLRITLPESDRDSGNQQTQAVMAELQRLLMLEENEESVWQGCAVLARQHSYLLPLQTWCEQHQVPYLLAADEGHMLPLTRNREFVHAMDRLQQRRSWAIFDASQFVISACSDVLWQDFFRAAFNELAAEMGDGTWLASLMTDWFYDYARELRLQPRKGLYLGTVHSAKGLEFRHVVVLDGGWSTKAVSQQDERRLYYVAMTRAEQTLTLCEFGASHPFSSVLSQSMQTSFSGQHDARLDVICRQLTLNEVDLGFAGRKPAGDVVHQALSKTEPGDPLQIRHSNGQIYFVNPQGVILGKCARTFSLPGNVESCDVAAIQIRYAEEGDECYRSRYRNRQWEVMVPRIKARRH